MHLFRDPVGNAVKLKPLTAAPRRATLLNTGAPADVVTDMAPSDHLEQKGYLRLGSLPANEMPNTVLVVKLEFDRLPESGT